ncbi:MAG: hypothetical protein R3B09_19025 [Nannocystaceae bacterium]
MTIAAWWSAYVVTQAIEIPYYLVATRGRPWFARIVIAAGASTMTHPMVWFVLPGLGWPNYWVYFAVAEGFAVVVEALLLAAVEVRRPLLWSLAANAGSVAIGAALRALIDWP